MGRKEGVHITCEAAPHHFTFTDEEILNNPYDTRFKMSPPLREKRDVEAIRAALKNGLIDVIATDHAPHHDDEKIAEFDRAPFGIIGLQTLVPLTLRLVEEGVISLEQMAALTSLNAAKMLNLANKGRVAEGFLADIAVVDPQITYVYDEKLNRSKSRNSPLWGKTLKGAAAVTIKSGRIVYKFGE